MLAKEQIELTAKKISEAFLKELAVTISYEKIQDYLNQLKKRGVTNQYTEIFEINGNRYLIRINGKLWPPYKRETEAHALNILKQNNIQTNVLFNGDGFQICQAPDEEKSLASYLEKNNQNDIYKVLTLVAQVIAQYQTLTGPDIKYPINEILSDVIKSLENRLAEFPETLEKLKYFGEICKKIITLGMNFDTLFCHNDFFPKSVFIDIANSKITIVDWEYAATAYWSNDFAMLGRFLTQEQFNHFVKEYFYATSQNNPIPDFKKDFINFNRFVLKFFYEIAWKINPNNIKEFDQALIEMKAEADILNKNLAEEKKVLSPLLEMEGSSTSHYSMFQPIDYKKRVWMPKPQRDLINAVLDIKMSQLIKKLQITTYMPNLKYHDKVSSMGWQLFFDKDAYNRKSCLAVLKVKDSMQANKLIDFIKKSNANLTAKHGKTENQDCVIITFFYDENLSNTIDKLDKELDKLIQTSQSNYSPTKK